MKNACNFIKKETLSQVFCGEFCKISNNIFYTEHLWMIVFKNGNYPGIDIAGFNPGQTWVLFTYGFSKTQLTWIKPASKSTSPDLAGSFKKVKSQVFTGFAGFVAKTTKPRELDSHHCGF